MSILKESLLNNPAHLWIGRQKDLFNKTVEFLQKIFCKNNCCFTCTTCRQIAEQQYHNIVWINPEKKYTLKHLEVITKTINFSLEKDQHLFFVLQDAEFLTPACSNSLLKSVEEPPPGYHFIFLAERQNYIMPTIQSRCAIKVFYNQENEDHNSFVQFFTASNLLCASDFLNFLNKKPPTEQETVEYIDTILSHWNNKTKNYFLNNDQQKYKESLTICKKITAILEKTPMPGSSKLFWRNFYLQMQNISL